MVSFATLTFYRFVKSVFPYAELFFEREAFRRHGDCSRTDIELFLQVLASAAETADFLENVITMRLTIGDSTRISYSASGIYDAVRHIPRLRAIIESFVGSFSLEIVGFAEEAHGNYSHDLCHGEKVQNEIITVTFQYGESSYVISPREPPAEIPLRVDNLFPYDFELHLERRAVGNSVQHGQDRLPVEVLPLREVRITDDAATGYEDHTSVELSFASFNSRMYRVIVNVMWRHR